MAEGSGRNGRAGQDRAPWAEEAWLAEVARKASQAAGGVPVELLGDYLPLLADAAATGRRPRRQELDAVGLLGRRAAESGVSAGHAVQLYLSAAWRLWRELPGVVRSTDSETVRAAAEAVLRAVDRAVASLAEGYNAARREMMRHEETLRRELIDDLLRGDADIGGLVERAEPFGMDMGQPHQVALAAPAGRLAEAEAAIGSLERAVVQALGDRDVLVATKDGRVVVVAPAPAGGTTTGGTTTGGTTTGIRQPASGAGTLGELMHAELSRSPRGRPWRIGVGRPYPGSYGIARSYEEARETLTMAVRLRLDTPVIRAEELSIYRVLLRDQSAITDLVQAVVSPLAGSRGGAEPLLATLDAYFASGCVVTETARRAAPLGPGGHLPAGADRRADRLRPHRRRPAVHRPGRGARREAARVARARPGPRCPLIAPTPSDARCADAQRAEVSI